MSSKETSEYEAIPESEQNMCEGTTYGLEGCTQMSLLSIFEQLPDGGTRRVKVVPERGFCALFVHAFN